MFKKFFIALGILVILSVVAVMSGGNEINSKLKEKEPEFRQYIAMTTEQQNAYIAKHLEEFFGLIDHDGKIKNTLQELKNDPAALDAVINLGRSIVASLILDNEDILKDLSAEIHNKLKAEADEFNSRSEKCNEVIQKYLPKEN